MNKVLIVLVALVLGAGVYWFAMQESTPPVVESTRGIESLVQQTETKHQKREQAAVLPSVHTAPPEETSQRTYVSPNGYSIQIPVAAQVSVHSLVGDTAPTLTVITSPSGTLCISVRVACDGVGMQGWEYEEKILASTDGSLQLKIFSNSEVNRAVIIATPRFAAHGWSEGSMQFQTTISERKNAEQMLASIDFQ